MIRWIPSVTATAVLLLGSASVLAQPITSMRVDGDVASEAPNHCRYAAAIHGTITPVKGSEAGKGKTAPVVNPNIDVRVNLSCPNTGAVKISDNVMATGPLTRDQLLHALERRATLVVSNPNGRCVYVPELALGDDGTVALRSLDSNCR